jgi:hypothetical protein
VLLEPRVVLAVDDAERERDESGGVAVRVQRRVNRLAMFGALGAALGAPARGVETYG